MTRLHASPTWLGNGPDMRLPETLNSSSVLPKAGTIPCREPPAACTLSQGGGGDTWHLHMHLHLGMEMMMILAT